MIKLQQRSGLLGGIHSLDDSVEGGVRPDGHVSATEVVVNCPDPMLRRLQVSLGDLLCVLFLQEKSRLKPSC